MVFGARDPSGPLPSFEISDCSHLLVTIAEYWRLFVTSDSGHYTKRALESGKLAMGMGPQL